MSWKKIISFFVMMLLFYSCFIATHESVHYVINRAHGIDSEFGICDAGICVKVNQSDINEMRNKDRQRYYVWRQSQDFTEVVGYHLGIVFMVIIMFLYLITEKLYFGDKNG